MTGGTGLIGGEVILTLARQRQPVRALVRATSLAHARRRLVERLRKSSSFEPWCVDYVDIAVGDSSRECLGCGGETAAGVETIIHCAANTSFSESERDRIWCTNAGGAANLVAFARRWTPDARIVFVSTASVVTAPSGCLDEEAGYAGHENAYTLSKRQAETIARSSGLDVVIVRPSIVLSRGVDDRAMARSILWALPIMREIGEVPIDPEARVDLVPVDFVAEALVRLAGKPGLAHRLYHISAGSRSFAFADLLAAVSLQVPHYREIRLTGAGGRRSAARRRLYRPIEAYLPFINASVQYSAERIVAELGPAGQCPASVDYVADLLGLITLDEAVAEMARP